MKPFHDLHKRIKQENVSDMSLRDYFAGLAIGSFDWGCNSEHEAIEIAKNVYKMADAMMEARKNVS